MLEHAHIGVIIHRWIDTSIVYANSTALNLLHKSENSVLGADVEHPQWHFVDESEKILSLQDYPVSIVKRTQKALKNKIVGLVHSDSDDITWVTVNAYREKNKKDSSDYIVVIITDITNEKRAFSFDQVIEASQDVVIVTEAKNIDYPDGPKIIYVNDAFSKVTGYTKEDAMGNTPRILQGKATDRQATKRIRNALEEFKPVTETLLNYTKKGRPYWIDLSIVPLVNAYNEVTHFAAIQRDISERKFHLEQLEKNYKDLNALKTNLQNLVEKRTSELKVANKKLEKIAFLDPLTNIPNRRYFNAQVTRLIKTSNRRGQYIAFGLIDVDDFKEINDSFGHDTGDQVLKALANMLSPIIRSEDAFCRYGGEEFAFCIAADDQSALENLSHRLIEEARNLTVSHEHNQDIKFTISIGASIVRARRDLDVREQLKNADTALYRSKANGKNQYTIY